MCSLTVPAPEDDDGRRLVDEGRWGRDSPKSCSAWVMPDGLLLPSALFVSVETTCPTDKLLIQPSSPSRLLACEVTCGSDSETATIRPSSIAAIGFHPGIWLLVSTSIFDFFIFGSLVPSDNLFFFEMLSVSAKATPGLIAATTSGPSPSGGSRSGRQSLDPDPHPYSRASFFLRAALFLSSQDWYLAFLSAGILLAPTWLATFTQSGKQ
jgi:hypothetical protein